VADIIARVKRPRRHGLRRRIAASIACLAFVLQSLVPVLAQAAASAARAQFYPGQLCSIDPHGARLRLAGAIDAEAPAPAPTLPSAAHCPFCALPVGADAPAPADFVWNAAAVDAEVEPPSVSVETLLAPSARGRPQAPRAPPVG